MRVSHPTLTATTLIGKTAGLTAAIGELGLSAHQVVGIGDAENDEGFLKLCGFAAAVANALPAVKEIADFVTESANGHGFCELIDAMIANDLAGYGFNQTWP